MNKCKHPDGIDQILIGEHAVDPCLYKDIEIHTNVTVTVSKCLRCGHMEMSWVSQEDSEHTILQDDEDDIR